MDEKTAAKVLENFNLWRRDDNIPNRYEMPNPTDIGIAIDIAVDVLKKRILKTRSKKYVHFNRF